MYFNAFGLNKTLSPLMFRHKTSPNTSLSLYFDTRLFLSSLISFPYHRNVSLSELHYTSQTRPTYDRPYSLVPRSLVLFSLVKPHFGTFPSHPPSKRGKGRREGNTHFIFTRRKDFLKFLLQPKRK